MDRRNFIASVGTAGTAAIAGCSDSETSDTTSNTDSDTTSSSNTDIDDLTGGNSEGQSENQNTESTETIIEEYSRRVDGREYLYWPFELYQSAEVNLRTTVRNGPNLDIIVTEPDEFSQFERGNRYRYNGEISQEDTVGDSTSVTLPQGDYYIFVHNTGYSRAEVDIELTLTG